MVQLVALWGWHTPALLNQAIQSHSTHLLMQTSLFLGAFFFWAAIAGFDRDQRWKPIIALLMTSKLFCLLAVLFVLFPRNALSRSGRPAASCGKAPRIRARRPAAGRTDHADRLSHDVCSGRYCHYRPAGLRHGRCL
ncbi:hypothetical protein HGP14_32670 [Rhizobium sp. P32RR-XVIII]|uniref:cytochrome c oxidase assembly protein n=1 Tax=Rhizobium sp. P32RR-XVIII TaxID=2726738 RepID=UPI00145784B7|nr:hypothetical protein [Rhizobium sp. P32RR-XVIII]